MGNLLINEVPLMCLPSLAVKIGLNEAIFLQQLHYWVDRSKNVIDGRKWVYNTIEDWSKQFPFWSQKTLSRTISHIEKQGLVLSGNYNTKGYDRTKWYTIDYDALDRLEKEPSQNKNNDKKPDKNDKLDSVQSIRSNCPNEINQGLEGPQNNLSDSVQSIGTDCPNEVNQGLGCSKSTPNDLQAKNRLMRTDCPYPLGQNDQMHKDKMTSPIPIDYTEITTDIDDRSGTTGKLMIEYQKSIHKFKNQVEADNFIDLVNVYPPDDIFHAIRLARERGGKSVNYVAKILVSKRKDDKHGQYFSTASASNKGHYKKTESTPKDSNERLWDALP